MKRLFIYYSFTGNGDVVAKDLREKGYDIRKVITSTPLPKNFFLSMMAGGFKATIGYMDRLVDFNANIDEYDEIVIGSPIWNSRISSPINTVLSKLNLDNKKITFILYSGSGKDNKAMNVLNKRYNNPKIINIKGPKNNKEELDKITL